MKNENKKIKKNSLENLSDVDFIKNTFKSLEDIRKGRIHKV